MREELDVKSGPLTVVMNGYYSIADIPRQECETRYGQMMGEIREAISSCFAEIPSGYRCEWSGTEFAGTYKKRTYRGTLLSSKNIKSNMETVGDIAITLRLPNQNKANRRVINKMKKRVYRCLPYMWLSGF